MRLMLAYVIMAVAGCLLSAPSWAYSEKAAVAFVEKTGLGNNLERMALRVAMNTQTYRMLDADIGKSDAASLVKKHIRIVTQSYQNEWNDNLAEAYLDHFSIEELNSIYTEKKSSPYIEKFQAKQKDVGASMQVRSKVLLQKVVAEALKNAFSERAAGKK